MDGWKNRQVFYRSGMTVLTKFRCVSNKKACSRSYRMVRFGFFFLRMDVLCFRWLAPVRQEKFSEFKLPSRSRRSDGFFFQRFPEILQCVFTGAVAAVKGETIGCDVTGTVGSVFRRFLVDGVGNVGITGMTVSDDDN